MRLRLSPQLHPKSKTYLDCRNTLYTHDSVLLSRITLCESRTTIKPVIIVDILTQPRNSDMRELATCIDYDLSENT